jgi:hypothetical protein
MENNLKPFNLQDALAGKPVVTRQGKKVTQLHLFDSNMDQPLVGLIEDEFDVQSWNEYGKYFADETEAYSDLFMEDEKISLWVNVYITTSLAVHKQRIILREYRTKENALKYIKEGSIRYEYIKTIEITHEL